MGWKKMNWAGLFAVTSAKYGMMLIEYRAQDSISMAATALYNLLASVGAPKAFRMFLPWRMSRMTIMNVRRTLSEKPIENNGAKKVLEFDVEIW